MAEEDVQVTAQRLATLFDGMIAAWADRVSVTERLEEFQREGSPAPPPQQPVEDLMVLARHARARKRHDDNLEAMLVAKAKYVEEYEQAAALLVAELVPEDISGIHTYLSAIRTYQGQAYPDLQGNTYVIDIRPDSVSVRLHEQ